jgi:hypothetical protein
LGLQPPKNGDGALTLVYRSNNSLLVTKKPIALKEIKTIGLKGFCQNIHLAFGLT